MAGESQFTIVGNLTSDPELRFTPSGAAVCNFTVASTPRRYNKQSGAWEDGDTLFLRCDVWRQEAENVAESLARGDRVIVQGVLRQRSFETKEGEKRSVMELSVDAVGPELRYATARPQKIQRYDQRQAPAQQQSAAPPQQGYGDPYAQQRAQDPWGTPPPPPSGPAWGGGGFADEPPF